MLRVVALLLGLFALSSGPAVSETYYVAPLDAVVAGTPDGTEGLPFLSIDAALKSGKVKGGDTLLLKDGAYGEVTIKTNAAFDKPVVIMSQSAKAAHFDSILLALNTRNLILRNLSVWPRDPATGKLNLVRAYNTTSYITVDGLDVRSEEGAGTYMQWDAAKWEARKFNGIFLQGPRSLVTGNRVTGVYHGIMVDYDAQIINNVIEGFNGDGLRAFSRSTVRGNRVSNCVNTDANHDDGFQSFAISGIPVTDLVIDSNVIIEWTGAPDHPLRCMLQGIGLFDGFYDNLTIVNNLVSVTQYHGITVAGARGAKIFNNTVVNTRGLTGTRPYIAIRPHRDGPVSTDVLVANNVAMSIQGLASTTDRVVFLNNSVIGIPSQVFENPTAFDYRPKASSGFIDTGDATAAPTTDVMGLKRPSGPLPDRGAYEVQVGGPPVDTGVEPTESPVGAPIAPPVRTPNTPPTGEATTTTGETTTTIISSGGSKRIRITSGASKKIETGSGGSKRIKIR